MDLESIYALMERFERSSLTGLELEQNGTRLKLDKTVALITDGRFSGGGCGRGFRCPDPGGSRSPV